MLAVIQKWGNHQGLCFTPEMLNQAQLSLGDEVFITVRQGEIMALLAISGCLNLIKTVSY